MTETTPQPLTTKQLYVQLEAEVLKKSVCGEKGVKIKEEALRLSEEIGKKKLLFRSLFTMLEQSHNLDFKPKRSHFSKVCEHNWEVTKDDEGLIWVDLSKPKPPKKKS